ncbi:MAG: YbaB/EbfC family nucleoid-associated protein [Deltaproteobacteria bacterium]|jgi:DNA-binding YbaB/EbfC family protein|nr:YbaB/EbfC family nucleoid-associated protein [Deltaproteobacteria bacterium]
MFDESFTKGLDIIKTAKLVREQLLKTQETAHLKTATATVGGGMVTVTVNGLNRVVSIEIEPEVINPADPEMLGDLILAAVNEALNQIQSVMLKETTGITAGLDLASLFTGSSE